MKVRPRSGRGSASRQADRRPAGGMTLLDWPGSIRCNTEHEARLGPARRRTIDAMADRVRITDGAQGRLPPGGSTARRKWSGFPK